MKRNLMYALLCCTVTLSCFAQPANEINCFQYFQNDNTGNSRVNAYLLMMLNYWVYPTAILNISDENDLRVKELHKDGDKFLAEYVKKVGHYFYTPSKLLTPIVTKVSNPGLANEITVGTTLSPGTVPTNKPPTFRFVNYNGGNGYDPEAVVISTDQFIIVVFRGTDRVASNISLPVVGDLANNYIYSFSEWVTTDFNFPLTTPLENLPGKVHTGFNTSLLFIKDRLEDTLAKFGASNKKIWLTGHSLGAAQAQLFGAYMKKRNPSWDIRVYAYAAPHVGDAAFVSKVNELLPGSRLQRFDFMDDPITNLPTYFMGYQRAGIRNLFTKEQGANYNFNIDEAKSDLGKFFFCLHHTEWYARATFFELLDHQPDLQGKIPNAPSRPTDFCSQIDLEYVTGSSNLLTAGSTDLPEGTYNIMVSDGKKFLEAPTQTADQNGTLVRLGSSANSVKSNQWIIKKVPGAVIESYTIQCVEGNK